MSVAIGRALPTSIRITDQDRARADTLMQKGLAVTFSDAVRVALALAVIAVDRIGATMSH